MWTPGSGTAPNNAGQFNLVHPLPSKEFMAYGVRHTLTLTGLRVSDADGAGGIEGRKVCVRGGGFAVGLAAVLLGLHPHARAAHSSDGSKISGPTRALAPCWSLWTTPSTRLRCWARSGWRTTPDDLI